VKEWVLQVDSVFHESVDTWVAICGLSEVHVCELHMSCASLMNMLMGMDKTS